MKLITVDKCKQLTYQDLDEGDFFTKAHSASLYVKRGLGRTSLRLDVEQSTALVATIIEGDTPVTQQYICSIEYTTTKPS